MTAVRAERMTAEIDGEVVVFLIGMRINRFWKMTNGCRWRGDAAHARRMPAGPTSDRIHERSRVGFPNDHPLARLAIIP